MYILHIALKRLVRCRIKRLVLGALQRNAQFTSSCRFVFSSHKINLSTRIDMQTHAGFALEIVYTLSVELTAISMHEDEDLL